MNYLEVRSRSKQRREFIQENTHLTASEIAKALDMRTQSVRKIAWTHNIPIKKNEERLIAKQRRAFMRENTHLNDQEIAKALGMQAQSVRKIASAYSIPIVMINPQRELTKKRIAFIKKNPDMTAKEIAEALHMEKANVNFFVKKHDLKIKSVYTRSKLSTEQRIEIIKANPDKTSGELARELGEKRNAIYSIALKYNLDIKKATHVKRPLGCNSNRLTEKRNDLLMRKWA